MHARGHFMIDVQGATKRDDVGELAKLAQMLGSRLLMEPGPIDGRPEARIILDDEPSTEGRWLTDLAAAVVMIEAVTRDRPVEQVLESIKQQLVTWHVGPLDKAPSDNRPFGAGHVEGQ